MPEHDCSKHTKKAFVKADKEALDKIRQSKLVAAILRVVAEYTDGFCAVEYAKDADLVKPGGMTFYFTNDDKRALFKKRIPLYLEKAICNLLTIT